MNVVRKIAGIFQVWRYLKTDRKKTRTKLYKMYSEWDFYEPKPNFSIKPGSSGDLKEGKE